MSTIVRTCYFECGVLLGFKLIYTLKVPIFSMTNTYEFAGFVATYFCNYVLFIFSIGYAVSVNAIDTIQDIFSC